MKKQVRGRSADESEAERMEQGKERENAVRVTKEERGLGKSAN